MPTLKALCQLHGDYGDVSPGEFFSASDEVATELTAAGLVEPRVRYEMKSHVYDTKVIVPDAPAVSARETFRHLPVSDARPETVASAGDPVFSRADVQEQGAADSGGRGGRSRPIARR